MVGSVYGGSDGGVRRSGGRQRNKSVLYAHGMRVTTIQYKQVMVLLCIMSLGPVGASGGGVRLSGYPAVGVRCPISYGWTSCA